MYCVHFRLLNFITDKKGIAEATMIKVERAKIQFKIWEMPMFNFFVNDFIYSECSDFRNQSFIMFQL